MVDRPDVGFLLMRVIVGAFMIAHGVGKLMGGPDRMEGVGESMEILGLGFAPLFWGFLAAITMTVGGFFVMIGFLFRLSCFLLFLTMVVATLTELDSGEGLLGAAHAIKTGTVFLGLLFIGPGRYAINK